MYLKASIGKLTDMDNNTHEGIEVALSALADVLSVPLTVTDNSGKRLVDWRSPYGIDKIRNLQTILDKTLNYDEAGAAIIKASGRQRHFVIRISDIFDTPLFVQSGYIPKHFAWTDGNIKSQTSSKKDFLDYKNKKPTFLLVLFIWNVLRLTVSRARKSSPINDLDAENIRRIGISLLRRIDYKYDKRKLLPFSLEGVPNIETLFSSPGHIFVGSEELTNMFGAITTGARGSFNIMSPTGDFLLTGTVFNKLCRQVIREYAGISCLSSDIECLIEAALRGEERLHVFKKKCYVGFTELFAPVFVDGLIVGLVFGGRLVETNEDADHIVDYVEENLGCHDFQKPETDGREQVKRTKTIVSGLAALLELIFGKYCLLDKWAAMGRELAEIQVEKREESFQKICQIVKKLMVAYDCSIFLLKDGYLTLAGTTADRLGICEKPGTPWKRVPVEDAIGKPYYKIGEGITGSVLNDLRPRFESNARDAEDWAGKCNEDDGRSQIFVAPIMCASKRYGVLRAVRPA